MTSVFSQYLLMEVPKSLMRKKKETRRMSKLAELNSAHRPSQAKCRLVTNQLYIKRIQLFLFVI